MKIIKNQWHPVIQVNDDILKNSFPANLPYNTEVTSLKVEGEIMLITANECGSYGNPSQPVCSLLFST